MDKYVFVSFIVLLPSVKCFSNWLVFFSCLFIYFNPGSGIAKTIALVTRLCSGRLRNLGSIFTRSKRVISSPKCPACFLVLSHKNEGSFASSAPYTFHGVHRDLNVNVAILISPLRKCSCCLYKLWLLQFCDTVVMLTLVLWYYVSSPDLSIYSDT